MVTKKPKSDDQIATILDQHIRFTTGYADSKLVKERARVLKYYDGELPLPTHAGNSKYVSQDVFESVEALKTTILEVFCTNQSIVEFSPNGPQDVEAARIATEYCSYLVFRENDGMSVFGDVIEDGLLARVGIAQFTWEEQTDDVEGQLGPASLEELSYHPDVADDNTTVTSLTDHQNGTYTANLTRQQKRGRVCIEAVPPEDFGITARAKNIASAKLCYRREAKTYGELLAEGHPKSLLNQLQPDDTEFQVDEEKQVRFEQTSNGYIFTDDEELDTDAKTYTVYHCYAKIDVDGTGIPRLWYVCKCGKFVLDKYRISVRPFAVFVPIPKGHSFYGSSFAQKIVPLQNSRSVLTRSILDHAVITNAPRWQVVKGGLMNPRELMDNRVGGLVNVTRSDAVTPLKQAPLNPYVFQTLQYLDQSKEDVTGVSRLSKGLNRDAVSTQNSRGLVEDLVSLSQRRQKMIARRFSKFLEDLYLGIYQLVLDHQDYAKAIEVAGDWVNVDPTQWQERTLVTAEITVGYGEMEEAADKLVQVDQYLSQPGLAGVFYDATRRYNVLSRALRKKGYKDVSNFLVPLAQQKPLPPDPAQMADVQAKQSAAKAQEMTAQANLMRIQFEREKWLNDHNVKASKEGADQVLKQSALDLKTRAELHREAVDEAEIMLQKQELDQATKIQGPYVHPNG